MAGGRTPQLPRRRSDAGGATTTVTRGGPAGLARWIPGGQVLPEAAWGARHRGILATLWTHLSVIAVWSLVTGVEPVHWLGGITPLVALAVAATLARLPRTLRASLATAGLVGVSGAIVHLTGGLPESHFHFFLVIAIVTLYQSWWPFAVATVMTSLHHFGLGALAPASVYSDPAAHERPLLWSLVHAGFILAVSVAHMVAWRMNEEARRDPLTSLTDRAIFEARLAQLLRAKVPTTVLLVDLDDFKRVNDRHGHAVGDAFLVAVAERLRVATREVDQVARLGGDEFAVLLPDTTAEHATAAADRLTEALARPFAIDGAEIFASASVGVASAEGGTAAELLRDADTAMYAAKRAGKARWTAFEPSFHTEADRRAATLAQLRSAAEDDRFTLRYAPVASLLTGTVVGWSAQVWWQPDGRAPESAADHAQLLVESGLIIEVGRRALASACEHVRDRMTAGGDGDVFVDVPMSLRELQEEDLVAYVETTLRAAGCAPHNLAFTVAEHAVLSDDDTVTANLRSLADLGIWVTLDGFGAGQSSIASLRPEVVGSVRLDRSLTSGLLKGTPRSRVRSLTVGIITVANASGLVVMADATGAPSEFLELRRLGVDLVRLADVDCTRGKSHLAAADTELRLLVQLDDAEPDVITLPELLHQVTPVSLAATPPRDHH